MGYFMRSIFEILPLIPIILYIIASNKLFNNLDNNKLN